MARADFASDNTAVPLLPELLTRATFDSALITQTFVLTQLEMLFSKSTALIAVAGLLGLSTAHNVQMKAHSKECFHEQLHKDDKMTVTFQVGDREFRGHGNLDIDFFVRLNVAN
jgi:hypothetical protein